MARDGEVADPRVPAPSVLRPVLGFSRLTKAAHALVARALDEDEEFRRRVAAAEQATEEELGRAGWLWIHRPEGWAEELATAEGPADGGGAGRLRRQLAAAEARADRAEQQVDEAESARRRLAERVELLEAEAADAAAERDRLRVEVAELTDQRRQALRQAKALEAELAETRRDLRLARQATLEAEQELAAVRSAGGGRSPSSPTEADGASPSASSPDRTTTSSDGAAPASGATGAADAGRTSTWERMQAAADLEAWQQEVRQTTEAVAAAVAEAAEASVRLSAALAQASDTLARSVSGGVPAGSSEAATAGASVPGPSRPRVGERAVARRAPRPRRVLPSLPPGILRGTAEANRHLLRAGEALVVVDGYNLARHTWSGLEPEEERRRTVALLEEVQSRSGGRVTVVFDGDSTAVAPVASRVVRVVFSPTGVTADDTIADLVDELADNVRVVVVSSDREVMEHAGGAGAEAMTSAAFIEAAGR